MNLFVCMKKQINVHSSSNKQTLQTLRCCEDYAHETQKQLTCCVAFSFSLDAVPQSEQYNKTSQFNTEYFP